ncbi:MAG: hypothetical protein RJA70_2150 [Pseudomonadota bacterium]|jgi:cysteine-rich repeat protein
MTPQAKHIAALWFVGLTVAACTATPSADGKSAPGGMAAEAGDLVGGGGATATGAGGGTSPGGTGPGSDKPDAATPANGSVCGDSQLTLPEQCDDGNTETGDGCDAECHAEPGWDCPSDGSGCFPLCESGKTRTGELCEVPTCPSPGSSCELFDRKVLFQGGVDGISHAGTTERGAGKFVFNRVYRASKYAVGSDEQFGVFHWWLSSYGRNSIEGGLWVNPLATGPYFYPTLHIAGVGDLYHTCSDVQFGHGMGGALLGDKWLAMVQISNRVLTVPGVNIGFDQRQDQHEEDNGIWIGWGWTNLNLSHPKDYKYWMSFVEAYQYQGPVNGYMPEYFNWVDPDKVRDGSYAASRSASDPFGTFATLGSKPDSGIANEQYSQGLKLGQDTYYVPVPRAPHFKAREYVISKIQSIEQSSMEAYSKALRENTPMNSLIPTSFLTFNGVTSSTHSQLKVDETIEGQQHLTVIRPPYDVGHDLYNAYVEWPAAGTAAQADQNGYLYYRKLADKWPVEAGASDYFQNHPHLYKSEPVPPPDNVNRVPRLDARYLSYKERDVTHPDFVNWDTTGKQRYTALLQNGATATYVWFKFIEQPSVKTAKQNWPDVYTDAYLEQLQSYVEALHRKTALSSKPNPGKPVFINSRNADDPENFDPHLAKLDPGQVVTPPDGLHVGYVPVIISVYHPEANSSNGAGLEAAPSAGCLNTDWTRSYFPDIP